MLILCIIGTFSVKVDMHYVLPEQCVKQARVFNNDTRGCYLLTHDPPVDTETYPSIQTNIPSSYSRYFCP